MTDGVMSSDRDFIPGSSIRIQPSEPTTFSDALYSEPLEELPLSGSVLTPRFYPVEGTVAESLTEKSGKSGVLEVGSKHDSISTGTFGNLVKRASRENPEDRAGLARQRIRYNLLRVGPKKSNSADRVEAWRKYLF